ncbi:MAG TPA: hypothetical protein VGD78_17750 [Chthoniobacterales bacterium]
MRTLKLCGWSLAVASLILSLNGCAAGDPGPDAAVTAAGQEGSAFPDNSQPGGTVIR